MNQPYRAPAEPARYDETPEMVVARAKVRLLDRVADSIEVLAKKLADDDLDSGYDFSISIDALTNLLEKVR